MIICILTNSITALANLIASCRRKSLIFSHIVLFNVDSKGFFSGGVVGKEAVCYFVCIL